MLPIYHCPPGIERPSHIFCESPIALVDGKGPGGLGGTMYGAPYRPEDEYQLCTPGWSVCLNGATPKDLLRRNAIPGFQIGEWHVPTLLKGELSTVGYWTAAGFQIPEAIAPLIDSLRKHLDDTTLTGMDQVLLAAEGIAVNYHVSIHELGLMKVLSHGMVWETLKALAGVAPLSAG